MEIVTSPRISATNEYFIAHNGSDIVHFDNNEEGQAIETGQPFLEVTTNEQEWLDRLAELGIKITES